MKANIFSILHWTPETFWNLTTSDYIAAMWGIFLLNNIDNNDNTRLSNDDKNYLKMMLEKDKQNG